MNTVHQTDKKMLTKGDLLKLKRYNTPTIYNGLEVVSSMERLTLGYNRENIIDYMENFGAMAGYAITVECQPSNKNYADQQKWSKFREYVASFDSPKIVVVKDLDKPNFVGAFWGEVNSSIHKSLGCVGCITDGAVRDIDEMRRVGFKALASRLCVGHAYVTPIRWGIEVEVFGCMVKPHQLIHADQHGFLTIEKEDEKKLLETVEFIDNNEHDTIIQASQFTTGMSTKDITENFNTSVHQFITTLDKKHQAASEWG